MIESIRELMGVKQFAITLHQSNGTAVPITARIESVDTVGVAVSGIGAFDTLTFYPWSAIHYIRAVN